MFLWNMIFKKHTNEINFYSWVSKLSFQLNTLKRWPKYRRCNYSSPFAIALLSSSVFCFDSAMLRAVWPLKDSSELPKYVGNISGHTWGDPMNCEIQMWRNEMCFVFFFFPQQQHLGLSAPSWLIYYKDLLVDSVACFGAAVRLVVRVMYGRKAVSSHCLAKGEHGELTFVSGNLYILLNFKGDKHGSGDEMITAGWNRVCFP